MLFVMMMMMAEMPMSFISSARQSIEDNDSVPVDTVLQPGMEASAKMKRDTSTMDSLELALMGFVSLCAGHIDCFWRYRIYHLNNPKEIQGLFIVV